MKRFFLVLFLVAAACVYGDDGRVVAVVGEKVFTAYDVLQSIEPQLRRLASQCTAIEFEVEKKRLFKMSLDALVSRELVFLDFKSLKNAKIPDSFVQERVDQAIASSTGGDAVAFEEKLYEDGMTMKEYRDKVFQEVAVEMLLRSRVKNGITVSNDAIEAFYQAKKFEMMKPMRYHLAVLMLKGNGRYADCMDKTVDDIRKAIAAKEPFDALVRKYSEGPAVDKGGDMGWMDAPHEALKAALKDLDVGGTTPAPVVIGSNRYFVHILAMEGGGVPPLDAAMSAKIKDALERQEQGRRYAEYIKQLKMKYPVKILDAE